MTYEFSSNIHLQKINFGKAENVPTIIIQTLKITLKFSGLLSEYFPCFSFFFGGKDQVYDLKQYSLHSPSIRKLPTKCIPMIIMVMLSGNVWTSYVINKQ